MKRAISIIGAVILGSTLIGAGGCGSGSSGGEGGTTYESSPLAQASPANPGTSTEFTGPGTDGGVP
jgi:hypothetical protein